MFIESTWTQIPNKTSAWDWFWLSVWYPCYIRGCCCLCMRNMSVNPYYFFLSKGIRGILFMEEKNLHCIVSNRNMWMARPFKNRPKFLHIFSLHLVVVFNTYIEVMMQYNTHISYSNLWRTLWTGYLGLGKYPLLNEKTYLGLDERLTKLAFT